MNPLEQAALAWQCLRATFALLRRGAAWVPWLLLALLQAVVLGLLVGFAHPMVSGVMAPLLARVAGEPVLHYPNLFRVLPGLFARADFLLSMVPGAIVAGAATAWIGAAAAGRRLSAPGALALALRRAVALVIVNLPLALVLLALTMGVDRWLGVRGSGGLTVKVFGLMSMMISLVVQALWLYTIPLVMLGGFGPLTAWRELPRMLGRGGWTAFTLVVLASLPLLPVQLLARFSDRIVDRGRPELVAVLTAAQIVLGLVVIALLTAAAALAYHTLEEEDGWAG